MNTEPKIGPLDALAPVATALAVQPRVNAALFAIARVACHVDGQHPDRSDEAAIAWINSHQLGDPDLDAARRAAHSPAVTTFVASLSGAADVFNLDLEAALRSLRRDLDLEAS